MLVRFDSKIGTLTMFGDIAVALIKLMGASGAVPGAIAAEDVPAALERLKHAVDAGARLPEPERSEEDEEEPRPRVSLRQRAWPLMELLKDAAGKQSYVMWEEVKPTFGKR